jgi:hypothetical protein
MRQVRPEELSREMTVSEWWTFVRSVFADLRTSDEGREYMRFHKGPVKRLKEEIVPTLRFAERQFPNETIRLRFQSTTVRPTLSCVGRMDRRRSRCN